MKLISMTDFVLKQKETFALDKSQIDFYDEVIDLIQEELKRKIAKQNYLGKSIIGVEQSILNTPNI